MFRTSLIPGIGELRQRLTLGRVRFADELIDEVRRIAANKKPLKVIIVGAGLAGLCAAYELESLGHSCVILEAESAHIGGRVRTARFANGLHAELGAMRIPANHQLTRHYVHKFSLPLRPFVQTNPEAYYYIRGKRHRIKDAENVKKSFSLSPDEQKLSIDDFWIRGIPATLLSLTDKERVELFEPTFGSPNLKAIDQLSLLQILERAGLSEESIELLGSAWGLETQLRAAATEHMREELHELWTKPFDEIVGGTDTLPSAFAKELRECPRLGCEVVGIDRDHSSAAVSYLKDGVMKREQGDFVICTVPLPVLSRIAVTPAFSPEKQRAIREVSYDSATKVLAMADRRFWETDDEIFGGGSAADLPSVLTYYPSDNAQARDPAVSKGPGVLLASYSWGQTARRLGALKLRDQESIVRRGLNVLHPQLVAQPQVLSEWRSWSWDAHKWAGGAFSWFEPGQQSALHRHLLKDEGRVLLAGEHMSLTHTWMQGALESALTAVSSLLRIASRNP
jgi:monoamine oxidase